MLVEFANKVLGLATIAGDIFIIALIAYYFAFRNNPDYILNFFSRHGLKLAFLVALSSTLITLFYSYYAGYAACDLCWYQRIFMYPQAVLLGLAWWKDDKKIVDYCLPLAWLGTIVALYHTYIYYGGSAFVKCDVSGVSCLKIYVNEFGGLVSIPTMSLTAFALLIGFLYLQKIYNKSNP